MSFANAEEARKHVRIYISVFAALAVLTVVTVAISYLNLPVPMAIAVAMIVACVKGGLVASYFMHLLTEKQTLFGILIVCMIFFAVLMLLPVLTESSIVHPQ